MFRVAGPQVIFLADHMTQNLLACSVTALVQQLYFYIQQMAFCFS